MKKIFFLKSPHYVDEITNPIPSNDLIPQWWRDGESFINKNDYSLNIKNKKDRAPGMKSCIPFLDAMGAGYLLTTWADLEITENNYGKIKYRYVKKDKDGFWIEDDSMKNYDLIGERTGPIGHTIPRPHEHSDNHFTWKSKWGFKMPKGWSMIVTHPMNQYDLPFFTLSGIIDSDRFTPNGNMPFFLRKGWTGVIEKGTPFAQLIPVKRSSWVAKITNGNFNSEYVNKMARAVQYGFYRSVLWVPKKYKVDNDK